jgi:hypothetical protein
MTDGHVIFSPAKRDFASGFFKLKVLKKRYDFPRCLWSDIWDLIKAVANPKGLGANHPKYRTTVSLRGLIIHISAFRKKHARRMMLSRPTSE